MPYPTINRPSPTVPAPSTGGCGCGCSSCDTCDSLQCLCRPRFFAGQLVTDADFRRLDQYLVGKQRLHNKFLHGTGAVCGLEVVCNPCDDTVTVRPGYALGPCGEDIVVCSDTSVDVGAMIRAQRRATARADCSNSFASSPNDCDALEQKWILGICYDEQPGRPVTSLTTTSCSSSGGCGCGGSKGTSGGGCGCGSSWAKPAPVGCEPTVICEGFRFTLTKVEARLARGAAAQSATATTQGTLAGNVAQCLAMLEASITPPPQNPSTADLVTYCCQLKADLRAVIESSNIHDCTLGQRLSAIVCPSVDDRDALAKAKQAIAEMLTLVIDIYGECLCSALLPPCPNDCADDCVPIATLTVRSSDLHVLEVCNWDSRKFAVTMPMLGYWLAPLGFGAQLRRLVSTVCCPPQQTRRFTLNDQLNVTPVAAEAAAKSQQASTVFAAPLRMATQYARHPSPLAGFEAVVLQGIGATGPEGAELASSDELADPLMAAALSRLIGPAGLDLGGALGDVVTGRAEQPAPAAADQESRLADLEARLEALQRTVRSQARTINNLRRGQQQ